MEYNLTSNPDEADRKTIPVLVLGATGMLGHKLCQILNEQLNVYGTVRDSASGYESHSVLDKFPLISNVAAENFDSIVRATAEVRPQVIINCIGIIKQRAAAKDPFISILVNSLFPHRLARLCRAAGIRLIHISTDCIFSGRRGNYTEDDVSDAEDLYGRTKFLGEVSGEGCLTLRTSIIGRELVTSYGLLEWFLSQKGRQVRGYKRTLFSGFTTQALAGIIAQIITDYPELHGVLHVAAEPISKFDLLSLIKQICELDIDIEPDETVAIDRSLEAGRFRQATGLVPRAWPEMIEQICQDPTPYAELRRTYAHQ